MSLVQLDALKVPAWRLPFFQIVAVLSGNRNDIRTKSVWWKEFRDLWFFTFLQMSDFLFLASKWFCSELTIKNLVEIWRVLSIYAFMQVSVDLLCNCRFMISDDVFWARLQEKISAVLVKWKNSWRKEAFVCSWSKNFWGFNPSGVKNSGGN